MSQEVVFRESSNKPYSNLGIHVEKDEFKFDENATSTGGPAAFQDSERNQVTSFSKRYEVNHEQKTLNPNSRTIDWP